MSLPSLRRGPRKRRRADALAQRGQRHTLADIEAAGLIEVARAPAPDGKPTGRSTRVRLLVDLGLPQRGAAL